MAAQQICSVYRYIKVVGGPAGREGLLLGLKDGQVVTLYVNNPFPIPLVKHTTSIRHVLPLASGTSDSNCVLFYFSIVGQECDAMRQCGTGATNQFGYRLP